MGFSLFPIEFQIAYVMSYVVSGLGFLLCLYLFVVALIRPRVAQRGCCGQCGYEASPAGSTCSECGNDYARVGLVTPTLARRLRLKPWVAGVAWTILVVQGASWGVRYISAIFPSSTSVSTVSISQTYEPTGAWQYRFGDTRTQSDWRECDIVLDADVKQDLDSADTSGTASIRFVVYDQAESAFRVKIVVDLDQQTFTAIKSDESEVARGQLKELTGETLARIAAASGFDFENEPGKRMLDEVEKLAAAVWTRPLSLATSQAGYRSGEAPEGQLDRAGGSWSTGSDRKPASKAAVIIPVALLTFLFTAIGWRLVYRRAR